MDSIFAIAIILVVLGWYLAGPVRRRKLPPGPYPFPIIGNIHQLGRMPHRSLAALSEMYGPLMSVQLGNIYTVVASSPEFAKLVLLDHDQVFSGRTITAAAKAHGFDKICIGMIPIGDRWRKLRKLYREQLFSTRRLQAGEGLRREKLRRLHDYIGKCSGDGRAVNLGEAAFVTSHNLLTATLFSADSIEFESEATHELKETIEGVTSILGATNVADLFPFLKRWDPQGIKRKSELRMGKLLDVLEGIINKRLELRGDAATPRNNDLLDTLIDSMEGSDYDLSFKEVQFLLLDLFLGGAHTTANTVEWIMAELLMNPEKMVKAKKELTAVIGRNKQIEESDISRLPYLQALIKETLRLHPTAPLLVPRRTSREVEISGYTIPQNAQIFVNIWAISRDPTIWENPNSFEPDRFLDSKIDYMGHDFGLIPFGSGKRVCPGLPLADRMLSLLLGSLIHNFDWELEKGEKVDTSEEFGLALHKLVPLKAIPLNLSHYST